MACYQRPPPCLAPPAPPLDKDKATLTVDSRPVKRLSQAEQDERRRLGLCYNCDEKYTRGHNRVCKRLFYINGAEIDDDNGAGDETAADAPVFSLHAVAGVPTCKTVQLKVDLGAASFVALIDTGLTHSFIGETAALCTGWPIQPRPRLTATVANGKVSCPGVLRQAPLLIDDREFHVDLFVMHLAGYDVVLGTE